VDARARRALLYPEVMRLGFLGGLCLIAACSSAKSGGAGAGGSTGTGGASATGTAGTMGAINLAESVLERGKNPQRTAHFIQPALTTAAAMTKMALDTTFAAKFSGAVAGVPLFAAGAKPGQGRFFVATLSNTVYALDETTGAVLWMHSIGMGGHGIIGSPVIDAGTRAIFVAADANAAGHHIIDALSIDTGDELPGWPVDVSKLSSGGVSFNSPDQNQRGALSLVGGTLYVPYGGYYGDGGNYRGWVVAVDVKNPANAAGWATSGQQEGIWAPGGLASDDNGVFAVTGNNGSAPETHLDSEEVVRVTGLAEAQRDDANRFWPTIWRTGMDMGDKDFGSCSPLVIMATGGTPASLVVAPAKPGHVYFLDDKNLGGLGGQVADLVVADTGAESVYVTPTTYTSASGLHVVISTTVGAVCPDGTKDSQLVGIKLDMSTKPLTPKIVWCAATAGDDDIRRRSAISTTTDGHSNALVWFMNGSALNAFDGETGAVVFTSGAEDCGGIHRHTSPIAANGRIIAAGDGHLCSWSPH
jgi:PQQ-like domain